jgi:hypothetical protein
MRISTMKYRLRFIFIAFGLLIISGHAAGQEVDSLELEPRTKLEAFEVRTGIVIIKGYSRVGTAAGLEGGSIEIETREFRDADGAREYGIAVEVREAGTPERRRTAFVDYDEIESLLKGLDYLGKIDSSATNLNRFEAEYRTRGDLTVSAFSTRGGAVTLAVSSGRFRRVTSLFRLDDLKVVRGLIIEAKNLLDAIRQK